MNTIQNYGMTNYQVKNNSIMFKANGKAIEDKLVGYLMENSARMDADAKRLEMEGRSLLQKNLPYQLTLEIYKTARTLPYQDFHKMLFRQIANCFRYGNRPQEIVTDDIAHKIQKFMSKSGKTVAKEDLFMVGAGNFDKRCTMSLPVYFDKESQIATVFTTKGEPQCRMKFISGGMENGVMKDFKVTEVFVPEKGDFVKTEELYSPLEEVLDLTKTSQWQKGTEPFFDINNLLK